MQPDSPTLIADIALADIAEARAHRDLSDFDRLKEARELFVSH
jgi:hypothetical protein